MREHLGVAIYQAAELSKLDYAARGSDAAKPRALLAAGADPTATDPCTPTVQVGHRSASRVSSRTTTWLSSSSTGAHAAASHLLSLGHRHIGIATTGFQGDFGVLDSPDYGKFVHVEQERMRHWTEPLVPIAPSMATPHVGNNVGSARNEQGERTAARTDAGLI